MSKNHDCGCGCHSKKQSLESHVDTGCSSGCECGSIEKANAEYEAKVDKNPNKKSAGNNQW